jgi:rod shape-determining protein MreC
MENLISRYRNVSILAAVLFVQVFGLAVQVKRSTEQQSTRLIRVWTVGAVAPLEKGLTWLQSGIGDIWRSYVYLRGVRQENRDLKYEIERLRLERVRLNDDAEQARRLQVLLGFKQKFISKTVAAQVIGSSGSEQSRSIFIDKGIRHGVEKGMPVITADGVVGRVLNGYSTTAQVLLMNDQTSGVGALLEKSRLQGIVRGTPLGEVVLEKVMSDEQVAAGETVLTSGGDRIFPKGLPIGTITRVSPGPGLFLNIRVRPMANLSKLEEVLVITKQEEQTASVADSGPMRAVDVLAQRLPSVPDKPPDDGKKQVTATVPPPLPAAKPQTNQIAPSSAEAKRTNLPAETVPKTQSRGTPAAGTKPVTPVSSGAVNSIPQPKPAVAPKSAAPVEDKPQ